MRKCDLCGSERYIMWEEKREFLICEGCKDKLDTLYS